MQRRAPSASMSGSASSSKPNGSRGRTSAWRTRSARRSSASARPASRRSTTHPAASKAVVRQLATCRWVHEHQQLLITGATGTGKSFLACAFAQQACRKGYRALYRRVPRLFDELTLAHADGTYIRLLGKLARIDVLVLEDWGLGPLRDQDRRDLLEILEDRSETRSTIITSQLPPDQWHEYLGDPTVADAICDRLLHNAHRLKLKGPSRRKEKPTEH